MWVGCQSRWFLCLFWREIRQRILGPEISPYPEVVRGLEWELARLRSWEAVGAGQQAGVDDATRRGQLRLDSREASSRELAWNHGQRQLALDSRRELTTWPNREGSWRLDSREASSKELAWNTDRGSQHRTPEQRGEAAWDRVQRQWVKMSLIPVALWNFP